VGRATESRALGRSRSELDAHLAAGRARVPADCLEAGGLPGDAGAGVFALPELLARAAGGLRALDLAGNCLGPRSAAAVARALRGASVLMMIDVSGNGIGEVGGVLLAAALLTNSV
jgi:hypothetical protein